MRLFPTVGLIAVVMGGAYVAVHPRVVIAFYEDAYPSNPARREALDMCIRRDPLFNRADAAARDACYRRELAGTGYAPAAAAPPPDRSFIDLYQAAGHSHQPATDIRVLQQNQRYLDSGGPGGGH